MNSLHVVMVGWLDEMVFHRTGLPGSKVECALTNPEDCTLCYIISLPLV